MLINYITSMLPMAGDSSSGIWPWILIGVAVVAIVIVIIISNKNK